MVEYASTFLISNCAKAEKDPKNAVIAPINNSTQWASIGNRKWVLASRYTPAATIVAAWSNAETGVGPSMASGSHTENGNCADLPKAPAHKPKAASNIHELASTDKIPLVIANDISSSSNVPNA